jgi:hypothetical protein
MLRDKTVIWLLLSYMLLQLGALFLGVGLFLFVYAIVYIIAIVHSAIKSSSAMTQDSNMKTAAYSLTWFFIANLVLFLVYLPTLIYNPEINWKLKGGVEQDPMILQAYVPIVFFIIAATTIVVTIIFTKLFLLYKARSTRLTQ